MERRYAQANGTSGHHTSTHNLRPTNSFIPTSASVHGHGHHGQVNLPHGNVASKIHMHQNISNSNIQQLPSSQSHPQQQQQQSHSQLPNSHSQLPQQSHHHGSNYYHQNSSGTNHTGGHHHSSQQPLHNQHQNLQHQQLQYQRAVSTKSYSSTHYNGTVTNPPSVISSNNIHHQQHHFYGSTTSNHQSVHAINGHGQQPHALPSTAVHQISQQQQYPPQQQQQHQYPTNNNAINTAYHNHYQPAETEGLPQTLVDSMRTLFDILDDTKQGKIRLSDIESRWETDPNGTNGKTTGAEPLIKMGVMGYLRKVTPPDGLLTFERFCAGLRLALLTNNNNASAQNQNHPNPNSQQFPQQLQPQQFPQQPSSQQTHQFPQQPPSQQTQQFPQQPSSQQTQQFPQQPSSQQTQQFPQQPSSQQSQQFPQQPPTQQTQQQTFHPQQQPMQVKTLTTNISHCVNSVHSSNNFSQSNSNTLPASSSSNKQMMLSLQNNQTAASNTMHRTSKIPSLSSSRLPMPSNGGSGIPVSPNNRLSATYSSTNGNAPSSGIPSTNGPSAMNTSNISTSSSSSSTPNGNTIKRHPAPPEQGTTVAIVHHQPKPLGIPSYSGSSTLKINKQSSTTVLSTNNKYNTKNGSLDNLKTPSEEKTMVGTSAKERPPSAPLLDNESDVDERPKEYTKTNHNTIRNNHGQSQIHSNNAARRERARSRDREREDRGKSPDDIDRDGNKRIHYVSPRQRTLSMPQLQLSKLKPKSIINIEDSPPPPSVTTSTETKKAQSSTANGLKSNKSLPLIAPSFVSAIPTIGMTSKQKNDTSPTASGSSNPGTIEREKERDKEQPPPPPKPPRNTLNGPVIVTTNMVSNEIIVTEVPQSGGSSSTISGNGSNPSKPEIRSALQTWQKGFSEKKPLESTLSSASTVNSLSAISVISNSTSTSTVPTVNKNETTNNNTAENEVKTRSNNKTNLRRRETPRRHTVQSGIDFATLKRLKQLEQERDVLQQGITYLEKAKEWYQKQLEGADEKIGLLSKGAPASEYWSESHEERLNLLGCRVSEVNSLLTALMDGSSLPLHMNLQIPTHLSLRTITRLKEQNRQLTQEVSECGHRVTQLEAEKAMLLRQLFHQKNNHHSEETVYM